MVRIVADRRAVLGSLLLVFGLVGCGDTSRILSPEGCTAKTTVDAELHVDTSDDRYVWAVDRRTRAPISLRIPGGYGVTMDPDAIVDPAGAVIGRTGDTIVSGCTDIVQNALMIDASDIRRVGDAPD